MSTEVPPNSSSPEALECPVCLQPSVQPVKLPCQHIFCFLCVKGASAQNQSCPLCRSPIDRGYLESPELISLAGEEDSSSNDFAWFYEGREGWWRYDDRTSREMEDIYNAFTTREEDSPEKTAELLIAGFIYVIDFENEIQYRKNRPGRRRKIKRDCFNAPSKGVAGLRKEHSSSYSSNKDEVFHRFNNLTLVDSQIEAIQSSEAHPEEDSEGVGRDTGSEHVS